MPTDARAVVGRALSLTPSDRAAGRSRLLQRIGPGPLSEGLRPPIRPDPRQAESLTDFRSGAGARAATPRAAGITADTWASRRTPAVVATGSRVLVPGSARAPTSS